MPRTIAGVRLNSGVRTTAGTRQAVRDFGTCLDFDSTDYVEFADNATLDIANAITLSAWIYPCSFGTDTGGRIFDKDFAANFILTLRNAANGSKFAFGTSNTLYAPTANNLILLRKWQHIAVTFDKDLGSNQINFYSNGVNVGSATRTSVMTVSNASLRLGRSVAGVNNFDGFMDELKIYNRALTATEIANEYYGINTSTSGLVLYTKFDEGSGTAAIDSSGIQANGTITGATYSADVVMVPRATA